MPKDERKRRSEAHERGAARRLGAKRHSGSGSGSRPQDMHTQQWLIECKTVLQGKRQITLKADDLEQLIRNAALRDQDPVLHVELAGKRWILQLEEDAAPL